MVKIIFYSLLACLLLSTCRSHYKGEANPELGMDSLEVSGIKLFTCLSGVSPRFRKKLNEKKVKRAVLINGGAIDVLNDNNVQKSKIITALNNAVPNKESDALIVIDIEGEKMKKLKSAKKAGEVDRILQYYIDVYKFAKKYRPNATIGFYGFPWRDYWHRNEKWRKSNNTLLPLFKEVDAIFPSVYDFYVDDVDVSKKSDSLYVSDNIKESLRIASSFDKPVYPFIWHRYHVSNKKKSRQFIPKQEFQNHIEAIITAEYEGKFVEGIVWWSSERYYYNVSSRGKKNRSNPRDFDRFSNETSYPYLETIIEGIQKTSKPK